RRAPARRRRALRGIAIRQPKARVLEPQRLEQLLARVSREGFLRRQLDGVARQRRTDVAVNEHSCVVYEVFRSVIRAALGEITLQEAAQIDRLLVVTVDA